MYAFLYACRYDICKQVVQSTYMYDIQIDSPLQGTPRLSSCPSGCARTWAFPRPCRPTRRRRRQGKRP